MQKAKNVDDYILFAPKEIQQKLKDLRSVIKAVAPEAQEKISYGMPFYEYGGKGYKGRLVYFGYSKNHIGIYLPPPTVEEHRKDLTGYKTSKSGVQFPNDKKLPISLIKNLVKAKMKNNK